MKDKTTIQGDSLSHDVLQSMLLLGLSALGGWTTTQISQMSGEAGLHWRLLSVLCLHPFALAAWLFCGLPGLALAIGSLVHAVHQRRVLASIGCMIMMAFSLTCTLLWL